MTLAQLEQYMAFYEENAALRETFSEDYRYGFGLLSGALVVDSTHRLLRIKAYDSALVFGPENLQSFRILEDSDPLFTGNTDGLTCHRSDVPDKVEMQENGVRFLVDVKNGQKTGFFLDQKENRAAIAPFVRGQRVLDCFTHTGSFALHAGHYGAIEVTGVDISDLRLRVRTRKRRAQWPK